jgi:hypothetical protein
MKIINENEPQIKAPRVTPLEGVSTYGYAIRVVWESRTARFRHDERRFANLNTQCSSVVYLANDLFYSPQRTPRTQSVATQSLRTLRSLR